MVPARLSSKMKCGTRRYVRDIQHAKIALGGGQRHDGPNSPKQMKTPMIVECTNSGAARGGGAAKPLPPWRRFFSRYLRRQSPLTAKQRGADEIIGEIAGSRNRELLSRSKQHLAAAGVDESSSSSPANTVKALPTPSLPPVATAFSLEASGACGGNATPPCPARGLRSPPAVSGVSGKSGALPPPRQGGAGARPRRLV